MANQTGLCLLCGSTAPFADAHIIPEWVYRPMLASHGWARKVVIGESGHSGILKTGIYDPQLVCQECESRFEYDGYAKRMLFDQPWPRDPAASSARTSVAVGREYDYCQLKLFFLSLLWRASATSRPEFNKLSLSPSRLKSLGQAILDNDPGDWTFFSVSLTKFEVSNPQSGVDPRLSFLGPMPDNVWGRDCYRLWLGEWQAVVNVDSKPFDAEYKPYCLAPDQPLQVFLQDFEHSGERQAMRYAAKQEQ